MNERELAIRRLRRVLRHGSAVPAWDKARLAKHESRALTLAARVVQLDGRAGEDRDSGTSRDVAYDELARVISEARGVLDKAG